MNIKGDFKMNRLEVLYAQDVKKITFNVRKKSLDEDKIILKGPRHSGKTYLILDLLASRKKEEFLYIDFSDVRIDASIMQYLETFMQKYPIKLLVLENLDFAVTLPKCPQIIITTNQKDFHLKGFKQVYLYPLDFEEFIAFEKRETNIDTTFSTYANIGTFPEMLQTEKIVFVKRFQQLLASFYENDTQLEILKNYALKQGTLVSVFALFLVIKEKHKISKDKFYAYTQKLRNEEVIFMVERYGRKSNQKKIYLIDFVIRGVLSFEKDFIKRFENMIFLELYKRGHEIFYTDMLEFFLPKEQTALLSMPFVMEQLLQNKLERTLDHFKELGVKKVQIITMELENSFIKNGITYEIMPFWSWALQL